jgi:hypothetical protein
LDGWIAAQQSFHRHAGEAKQAYSQHEGRLVQNQLQAENAAGNQPGSELFEPLPKGLEKRESIDSSADLMPVELSTSLQYSTAKNRPGKFSSHHRNCQNSEAIQVEVMGNLSLS